MAFPDQLKQRALELYQGCSAVYTLRALGKELPNQDMPTERTIRRWRNEKRLEEHFEHMTGIAALILTSLDRVIENTPRDNQFDIFKYSIMDGDSGWGVTHEQLSARARANIELAAEQYMDTGWNSFKLHLTKESPEIESKGLRKFARENPYQLIEILKALATRKTFMGSCPVCEHWH